MSYDDIMCRIEELVGDLYHEGYENGWQRCASQATHDYTDEWCDGFLTAWNAIAHEGRGWCRDEGDRYRFECSECGADIKQGMTYKWSDMKIRYCPYCGAEVRYD